MAVSMGLYLFVWQMGQKRSARQDRERREELSERGFAGEGQMDLGMGKEKGVDRDGMA